MKRLHDQDKSDYRNKSRKYNLMLVRSNIISEMLMNLNEEIRYMTLFKKFVKTEDAIWNGRDVSSILKVNDLPRVSRIDHNEEVSSQWNSENRLKQRNNSSLSRNEHDIPTELDKNLDQYSENSIRSNKFICNFEKRTQMRKIMLKVLLKHSQNNWHLYEDFSDNFIHMEMKLIL